MKQLQILRQAPDSAGGNASDDTPRTKIADRDWVDGAGAEASEETATGVRYTLRHAGFFGPNVGQSYTHNLAAPGTIAGMLEAFGALTLMGNLVNTWKTLDPSERSANPIDMIRERFELLGTGQWIDRTGGGVGQKIDKDALASAIVQVAGEAGKTLDYQVVRQKLEEDAAFGRQTRQVPQIAAAYATIVGRTVKSLDDVLGSLAGTAPTGAPATAPAPATPVQPAAPAQA